MNFASPAAIFVSSFVIALSGALMPGPLLAVTVRDTARYGFGAAPLLVAGHALLEAALVALILMGLAKGLASGAAAAIVPLAGAAMLLWMAQGMAREARHARFALDAAEIGDRGADFLKTKRPIGRPILDGAVVSASNPYWIIWWATIGLGYLVLSRDLGRAGILLFFAGHILADAAWYLFVGMAVSLSRGCFTDRVYRTVLGACALCLAVFALGFGYLGLSRLAGLL